MAAAPDNPFEPEMQEMERSDARHGRPSEPVLFYGSSSMRLWPDLRRDFPGLPVLNRAFGGSTLEQCVRYMQRLVIPYNPRAVVLYAGDNDLAEAGRSPGQVRDSLREFLAVFRGTYGGRPVTFLSIKPSPSRMHLLDKVREANRLCRDEIAGRPDTTFLDVFTPMMGPDGKPRRELFADDGLHLSAEGYRLWRRLLWPWAYEYLEADAKDGQHSPNKSTPQSPPMNREYHKWYSPRLGRDMELLVFGHGGARVLVFPTRAGRFHEYEDGGMVAQLHGKIAAGHFQLFCVDSVDAESLYCFWKHPAERIRHHVRYEEYVLNEVLPFTRGKNPHPFLISHGCSLGAFHAMNIALRHPHLFGRVVAFSGRYDLTQQIADFRGLFDGYHDDTIYFHTPNKYLPGLHDPAALEHLRRMQVTLTIGEHDPFIDNNRHLSHVLHEKGVRHDLFVWGGRAHRFADWRQMAPIYL
jgi:esterase/lipase superfamily enzyme/lysophospholipase L1-like esterase